MRVSSIFIIAIFVLNACGDYQYNSQKLQIFRYNESKSITTLDPAFARNLPLIWPTHQLYNGLIQLDDSLRVKPCVAKYWTISDDRKTYTFYLRTDVFFHKSEVFPNNVGRKVMASDFVYSFNRILNPEVASPGAWVLACLDKSKDNTQNGCIALNDSVFQINLKYPFPAFLGMLSMPYCYVVPHEAVEKYGKDFRSHPVGTGPFYLKYWKEGEKLIFRRNINYFEYDDKGNKLPYLESVSISFIADKQSEFLEFIKGKIDFISDVNSASKDELLTRTGNLNQKYNGRIKMITGPYLNTEYLGILVEPSLFKDKMNPLLIPNIRKAIGFGIDRAKLITFLRSNLAYPAFKGFVPSGMPEYAGIQKGFEYNPSYSQELLRHEGYSPSNPVPSFSLATTDDYADICEFIQHQLNELGFDINVDVYPGAAYREMLANSKLSFFRASWVADYADPENYLALFNSQNLSPSGPNYTHFKDVGYDELYYRSLSEPLAEKRMRYYQKMDSIVVSRAIVIPLFYDKVKRFVSNDIEGMCSNPMNLLDLKRVRKIVK